MTDAHVTKEMPCPMCSYVADRASAVDDTHPDPPVKGDFSVCFGCACILVYDQCDECGDLLLRLPQIEEAIELEANHEGVAQQLAGVQTAIIMQKRSETPGWFPPWAKDRH